VEKVPTDAQSVVAGKELARADREAEQIVTMISAEDYARTPAGIVCNTLYDFEDDTCCVLQAIAPEEQNEHLKTDIVFSEVASSRLAFHRAVEKLQTLGQHFRHTDRGGEKYHTRFELYCSVNERTLSGAYSTMVRNTQYSWADALMEGSNKATDRVLITDGEVPSEAVILREPSEDGWQFVCTAGDGEDGMLQLQVWEQ
jgi:hypothetical protein